MKINSNLHSLKVQKELKQTQNELDESSLNLASGKRVNSAADNSSDSAVAAVSNAQLKSKSQAQKNLNQMIGVFQVGEGAINVISKMVVRMRELAIQSASDGIGDGERTSLNYEVLRLRNEINRINKTTSFNGINIFSGEDKNLEFHIDSESGGRNKLSINLKEFSQSTWALGIFDVRIDSMLNARNSLVKIDFALNEINKSIAKFGAMGKRVESIIKKLDTDKINISSYRSKVQDSDVAYEKSRNVKAQIQQKAQTYVASYVNIDPNAALKLL